MEVLFSLIDLLLVGAPLEGNEQRTSVEGKVCDNLCKLLISKGQLTKAMVHVVVLYSAVMYVFFEKKFLR